MLRILAPPPYASRCDLSAASHAAGGAVKELRLCSQRAWFCTAPPLEDAGGLAPLGADARARAAPPCPRRRRRLRSPTTARPAAPPSAEREMLGRALSLEDASCLSATTVPSRRHQVAPHAPPPVGIPWPLIPQTAPPPTAAGQSVPRNAQGHDESRRWCDIAWSRPHAHALRSADGVAAQLPLPSVA